MTAIFHCGREEAARQKGNQATAGFLRVPPDGATWLAQSARSHNADFCVSMQISAWLWSKSRNAAGGFAGEHQRGLRMYFWLCERMQTLQSYVCYERAVKPKGHGSSHEALVWEAKNVTSRPVGGEFQATTEHGINTVAANRLLLCFLWSKIKASVCFRLGALFAEHQSWIPIYHLIDRFFEAICNLVYYICSCLC